MNRDLIILCSSWIVTIVLLIKFIPKNKICEAQIAFMFMQVLSWILGVIVVELNLLKYPIRLFPNANNTSFSFEYFIYPSLSAIFVVHYPKHESIFKQLMYYCVPCTILVIIEIVIERHTNIIKYIHWHWTISWISIFITLYITNQYIEWFFGLLKKHINN